MAGRRTTSGSGDGPLGWASVLGVTPERVGRAVSPDAGGYVVRRRAKVLAAKPLRRFPSG